MTITTKEKRLANTDSDIEISQGNLTLEYFEKTDKIKFS